MSINIQSLKFMQINTISALNPKKTHYMYLKKKRREKSIDKNDYIENNRILFLFNQKNTIIHKNIEALK